MSSNEKFTSLSTEDLREKDKYDTLRSLKGNLNFMERVVEISDDERALGDLSVEEMRAIMTDQMNDYMKNFLKRYKPTITYEDTWNHGIEEKLRARGEQAYGYAWMHNECVPYFERRHKIIWVTGILFGLTFAGGGVATIGLDLPKFFPLLSFGGTTLSPVIAYLSGNIKYDKRSIDHSELKGKYENLKDEIEEELKKDRVDRVDAEKFMEETRKKLYELSDPENSPNIPKIISKKYGAFLKISNQLNLSRPVIAGGKGGISIKKTNDEIEDMV